MHAAANTTALALYAASWLARVRGRHAKGVALGLAGATAATVGGYLGGHLLQSLGVGVDRTAIRPSAVGVDARRRRRRGRPTTPLPRARGRGAGDRAPPSRCGRARSTPRCPHRGAPMDEGEVRDGCITCPWHGSVFRVDDGALVQGPSTVALPAYECRVVDDDVEVRAR